MIPFTQWNHWPPESSYPYVMGITLPIHQGLSDFTKSFSSHHVSLHLTKDSLRSSRGPADTLCARGACPLGALLIGHAVTAYMGEALPAEGRAEQGQDAGKPRPISGSYSAGKQDGCWGAARNYAGRGMEGRGRADRSSQSMDPCSALSGRPSTARNIPNKGSVQEPK